MKQSEILLSGALICMLFLLIFPLTPFVLDLMLALNLMLSVMILFIAISVSETLEFSTFPSLLLILTLFRLGLNIASTRLILSKGEAGAIISTFGNFVTSGSTLIGFVLFALLTVINFIVITKGAGRIAEVAARFTLESLTGKQSAIDAELTAGLLTADQAKERHQKTQASAEFYGAMDGASKFVRGDAIASILIAVVNIVGGLIVGMTARHLTLEKCFSSYLQLTIGDGLVTQIPALIISLSGALMVTRASQGRLAEQLLHQLFRQKKVIILGATVLLLLSLLPGMPGKVLIPLSGIFFLLSIAGKKKEAVIKKEEVNVATIEILLGMKLLASAESLLQQIGPLREKLTMRLGLTLPSIHLKDNLQLPERSFQIKIKGICVHEGHGDLAQVVEQIERSIIEGAHELLNRQDVVLMLEKAKLKDLAVVDELIGKKLQLGDLLKILQNLLREKFIICDLVTILETIADHLPANAPVDLDLLTEFVRQKLARGIFQEMLGEKKELFAITLDPKVEQMLSACIKRSPYGATLLMRPTTTDKIEKELEFFMEKAKRQQLKAVVLTTAQIRRPLSQMFEKKGFKPEIFSYEELDSSVEVKQLGTISNEVLI